MGSPLFFTLLIASCFNKKGHCLGQEYIEMIDYLMQKSNSCMTVLFKMDKHDSNIVSSIATGPILMLNDYKNSYCKKTMQYLISVRQSHCALLFVQEDSQDENAIQYLLNQTRHRTVYVMQTEGAKSRNKFQSYFMDSVLFVEATSKGNLHLKLQVSNVTRPILKMIWWRNAKNMLRFDSMLHTDRRTLKNKSVTAALNAFAPYVIPLANNKFHGIEIDIFNIVSAKIGFQYALKREFCWVCKNPVNKEWMGVAGNIIHGQSQFGLMMTNSADIKIDMSPQTYGFAYNYLVPKPKPLKSFNNFIRPFSLPVWLCVLFSWACFFIMAVLINKYLGDSSLTSSRIILDLFGTAWQQKLKDSLVSPSSGFYYIFFAFWIIGMTFKGAAYSCNLRAFMVMKEYEKPMETEEDIVNRNVDVYIGQNAGELQSLQKSPSPEKRELAERAIKRHTIYNQTSGIFFVGPIEEKLVQSGGARLTARSRNRPILKAFEKHYGYQPLQGTKTDGLNPPVGMAMPMYQPWKHEVDRVLLQLLAGGIVNRILRQYIPPEDQDGNVEDDDLEPYRIEHVAGPLVVLSSGLILSILAACLEKAHFDVKRMWCNVTE